MRPCWEVLNAPHGPPRPVEKVIYGDNCSAISIASNSDGGWRTRHLRLRASGLREALKDPAENLTLRHLKGTELVADLLTKPIVSKTEWVRFWVFLNFHVGSSDLLAPKVTKVRMATEVPVDDHLQLLQPSCGPHEGAGAGGS